MIIKEISRIAPNIGKIAFGINTGVLKGIVPNQSGNQIKVNVLKQPSKSWAEKVDNIEAPFVEIYDEDEYGKNNALTLMGLFELKLMLNAFGVRSAKQTEYQFKPLENREYFVAGTGTGREVINLAALGGNVIGIDATKGYVDLTALKLEKVASALGPTPDIKLFQCPAEDYPYISNSFDGISSLFGVVNHIQDWKGQLKKFGQALKSDGKLVIEKYGSNDALVFKLRKNGQLKYSPSILQRRDPKGQGILLGDSEEILPANFPSDRQFKNQLTDSGFEIQKKVGFLRIAALFPKVPTAENLIIFLELVSQTDTQAYDFLYQFKTPEELLFAAFMYDLQSQQRKNNPVNIEDFAYVLYVGRKKRQEEFLTGFSR
ncbi:MAG: class I SAM-dependent methyltransferase [Patescibacteria group bacterium]|jgi:SAM-dependent methyltransferase